MFPHHVTESAIHFLPLFVLAFSNGVLDPWSGGGVLESVSDSLVAVVIPMGAHHLDLRSISTNDPAPLTEARQLEMTYISKWLQKSSRNIVS